MVVRIHKCLPNFVFLVLLSTSCSSVVIKSGVVKDLGQLQDAKNHDVQIIKGLANFEGEQGFNKNDESKHVNAQDQARYGENQANKKEHLDQNNFAQDKFHQTGGGQSNNQDSRVAHHKGHHKSGFHNSYHKDESGHNSSYFDDANDQGDEAIHRNTQAQFGDQGQERQNAQRLDQSLYDQNQVRNGAYDNHGRYDKDIGQNSNYNRNNYYQNKEDLDRKNLGNRYHGDQHYAQDQYIERPPFHNGYYPPPVAPVVPPGVPIPPAVAPLPAPPYYENHIRRPITQNRITVYEDPRYIDELRYRRRSDDVDYLNLDIRSPAEREKLYYHSDYYYD